MYHRLDGPALEWVSGTKVWYQNGVRHREDGPAVEFSDGGKYWYWEGVELSEEEHAKYALNKKLTEQLEEKPTVKKIKI